MNISSTKFDDSLETESGVMYLMDLVKNNLERAGTVLYNATESLRQAMVLLRPIMPVRMEIVLKMIGTEGDKVREPLTEGLPLGDFEIPFPKIEMPESDKKEDQT